MPRMGGVDSSYGHCDVQLQRDTNHHHQVRVLAESRHVRGHSDEDHRDVRRFEEVIVGDRKSVV